MGFSRIKECLDLVIFFLSSVSLQLCPTSVFPLLLHFYVCMQCLLRLPSSIPAIKQQMTTSLLRPFKIRHQKCVVAALTCNKPLIDPCGFCMSPPSSLHKAVTYPPSSQSERRASAEIRSSLSEVLCHVAQGAWNSPRAVEQTQAQGLSIAAPQTNCLSNEPPSLSWPHTHTHVHAAMCVSCDIHTLTHRHTLPHTQPI